MNAALIFCIVSLFASTEVFTQKKKSASNTKSKTAVVSKSKTTAAKDAKNNKNTKTAAKESKAEKNSKDAKASKVEKTASVRKSNSKESRKELAVRKAAEAAKLAERRRAENIRRLAILEEQRRREAAIRAAAARRAAFERGLRTDTVEKIQVDDTTGEDLQIRQAAVNALGSHAGTVVVMEAQTGKIVTIVNQDWAIRNSFKPCSTIKLITAAGGKNEELIDNDGNLTRQNFRMNLDDALAFSNNAYFQKVGANLGNEKMISYARALGLGEKTGINSENETTGKLPYGNNNARIYSHGDDFEVTPLQLAVAVTAIANGGKLVVPQIQKNRNENAKFNGFFKREVNVPKQNIQRLIPGMLGAAEYGTARRAGIADLNAAGKTGSCIFNGSWIGLFASVAPVESPQYAVVVITRGQSERGKYAAQIAGKIYEALRPRFTDKRNKVLLAQFKPNRKVDIKDKELLSDDEENDSDDNDMIESDEKDLNPKKGILRETVTIDEAVSENPQKQETKIVAAPKTVTNIKKDSPVFKPVVIEYKKETEETETVSRPQITRPRVVANP
ncbi:MAG: penicillin-binding transpeptidase domain-containing protein [Pyrinomonadaceae bacterium]